MTVATDLEQIAAALEARGDEIIDAGVAAIRERIPAYGAMDARAVDDVRAHVALHQAGIVAALRGRSRRPRLRRRARRPARAHGLPLPDFLQAFRAYHRVLWRVLMEIVEEHGLSGRATLEAARPVMDYIDLAATARARPTWRPSSCCSPRATACAATCSTTCSPAARRAPPRGLAAARAAGLERAPLPARGALPVDRDDDEFAIARPRAALAARSRRRVAAARRRAPRRDRGRARGRPTELAAASRSERVADGLAVGVSTSRSRCRDPDAYAEASQVLPTPRHALAARHERLRLLTLRQDATANRMVDPASQRFVR